MVIGIIAGALKQLKLHFSLSCTMEEMIVSSMLLGALFGSIFGGYFIDKCGRKPSIIASSILYLAGALFLALAQNYVTLIIGRVMLGFAMSLAAASECVYVSELAPANIRGSLVSLNEFGITIGILLSYFMNVAFSNDLFNGWRFMFGLSSIGAFVVIFLILYLPPSPRYLLMKGQADVAKQTLRATRIHQTEQEERMIDQEFSRLESQFASAPALKCADLFGKRVRYPACIGALLVILQQSTGEPNVLFYANTILSNMGFRSDVAASLGAVGLGVAKVLATIVCFLLVDKWGRRTFLLAGSVGMAITIFGLALLMLNSNLENTAICTDDHPNNTVAFNTSSLNAKSSDPTSPPLRYFALILLMIFIAAYSMSFGPVSWIVLSEIFPMQLRGRLFSFTTSLNWASNLVVSSTFLGFMKQTGGLTWPFLVNSFLCFVSVIFIYFVVPETRGKTLEGISALWDNGLQYKEKLCCCCKSKNDIHRTHLISASDSTDPDRF